MFLKDFIISIYLFVDKFYQQIITTTKLRKRGYSPTLTDVEVITIQLVGEYLSINEDKRICDYFKTNWYDWFPKLGSYPNFAKQFANLWKVNEIILAESQRVYLKDILLLTSMA